MTSVQQGPGGWAVAQEDSLARAGRIMSGSNAPGRTALSCFQHSLHEGHPDLIHIKHLVCATQTKCSLKLAETACQNLSSLIERKKFHKLRGEKNDLSFGNETTAPFLTRAWELVFTVACVP